MNAQPEAPAIPCPAPGRKRRAVLWLASATLLLVVTGWLFALRPLPGGHLVWLTPAQFARATQQTGPWTKWKNKLARLVAPLGVFNWRSRPNILVRSTLMALTSDAIKQAGLPAASLATNADGTRVWVLSAAELKILQQRLKATPSASVQNQASMITLSGRAGQIFSGQYPPPGASFGPVGLSLDLTPKFISGSINVMLGAASTEKTEALPGNATEVRTNLSVACRASLPNAGALVVDAGLKPDSGGTNYWLIVSPMAVDARGNPL